MKPAVRTPCSVCFNCGYDMVGLQRAHALRCPECGVRHPVQARSTVPWPPVHRLALSLAWVGLVAGGVVVAIAIVQRTCDRLGYADAVEAFNAIGGIAAFLGLLLAFVYAVSKPDDLLARYGVRRERNSAYVRLLALSFAVNVGVMTMVLLFLAIIHRVL